MRCPACGGRMKTGTSLANLVWCPSCSVYVLESESPEIQMVVTVSESVKPAQLRVNRAFVNVIRAILDLDPLYPVRGGLRAAVRGEDS